MALPEFNSNGDLPVGVHQATIDEVVARFGTSTAKRAAVTANLERIYHLAKATGQLEYFILFGSYITNKPEPNDVDILLIVSNDFDLDACDATTHAVFEHQQAQEKFGASIFWITPAVVIFESIAE